MITRTTDRLRIKPHEERAWAGDLSSVAKDTSDSSRIIRKILWEATHDPWLMQQVEVTYSIYIIVMV
jgi:hypothetical protein